MASKVKATTTTTAPTTNGDLPKGWRMVRFGEVVRDVNEAERNPLDAGLERMALSKSIRIRLSAQKLY